MLTTSIDEMTSLEHDLAAVAASAGDLLVEVRGEARVTGASYDSRSVEPGDLFFCIQGTVTDGHLFAASAVEAGAAALCVERIVDLDIPQMVVTDSRLAMGRVGAALLGDPSAGILLLGVTGTNGKTTTAFLLESILRADGHTTGLIGTIETRVAGTSKPGVRTTPESLDLQKLFAEMRDASVDAVAMEVTSHALALHRVEGLHFAAAAFTNLSQDHLDFHAGMEDYFQAKKSLFVPERVDRGAVNIDDPYGRRLKDSADVPCISFGISDDAQIRAVDVTLESNGSRFTIVTSKGDIAVETRLVGAFNVFNCLAATATALQAGIGLDAIERGLKGLEAVPGRFEAVDEGQPFAVVVDYAHTPDSLDNVLRAARDMADARNGRVICAFGCGGDRDRGKRPLMGAVVAKLADVVVVTSDNPRSEDPVAIIDEILEGVVAERPDGPDEVLVDRAEAIRAAISVARDPDVVVIAGKGHESGQEFADRTIPFLDSEVARGVLESLGWSGR